MGGGIGGGKGGMLEKLVGIVGGIADDIVGGGGGGMVGMLVGKGGWVGKRGGIVGGKLGGFGGIVGGKIGGIFDGKNRIQRNGERCFC